MRVYISTLALCFVFITGVGSAQWLNYPDPRIPRKNGKPDLSAPATRTADGKPDFSGVWRWNPGRYGSDVTLDLRLDEKDPAADALMRKRQEELAKDDPALMRCLPQGPRTNLFPVHLTKIAHSPGLIIFLYENMSFRQVFMDGRPLPSDPATDVDGLLSRALGQRHARR